MCPNCESTFSTKKFILAIVFFAFSFWGLDSYAEGKTDHHNHDHSSGEMKKASKTKRIELPMEVKKSVQVALATNEKLHGAFFKYEGAKVEAASKDLEASLSKIKDKDISKLLKFSKTKLSEIKASKSREENNNAYNVVSMALIYIVNKYDVGDTYNAYSCPMVKKKWVQNSEKIEKVHNPYAPNMPHCGSKDTDY